MLINPNLVLSSTSPLTQTVQQLTSSLSSLKPDNSPTAQLITYVLVGAVVAGLLVYHYIKEQEAL